MSTDKHKVFISYHHGDCTTDPKCGRYWKDRFEQLFAHSTEAIVSRSVKEGDIGDGTNTERIRQLIRDNYIAQASVVVVLIGPDTWKRKHVDWEISSAIRETKNNPRCGLLGILLPTYPSYGTKQYNRHTIPPRLYDNAKCEYAALYEWTEDPYKIQKWIHQAFIDRKNIQPVNSYPMFANNRADHLQGWQ